MLRKFIQVEDGIIRAHLEADLAEDAPVPDGLTEVPADVDLSDASFRAYDDQTTVIGQKQVPSVRKIPLDQFMDRITIQEGTALRMLAQSDTLTVEQQAALAEFTARLYSRSIVDLDHPDLIAGFALVKSVGVPAIWADNATADVRIAAFRA